MEQKVYERQVTKQATAKRVIDEQQISRHYNQNDLQELYTYELDPRTEREIPILPKDKLFAELLSHRDKVSLWGLFRFNYGITTMAIRIYSEFVMGLSNLQVIAINP